MDGSNSNAATHDRGLDGPQGTPFGAALAHLIDAIQSGAPTDALVAGCKVTLNNLPITTLADAARALDVEVAALEAEGPGRVWRIAVVGSVRDLLVELASVGRATALLPAGADAHLLRLESAWLSLLAESERDDAEGAAAVRAAWSALLAVADAPAHGLTGVLVKLRVLLRFLADTAAADPDSPEQRLLTSTREAVERLIGPVAEAETSTATRIDDLFAAAGEVLAPLDPSPHMIEAGAQQGGVSASVARRIYATMLGVYQRARGGA
ncbi:hypothetical protein ACIU1J_32265 [Azospirillum doebereinerae]|uniref:hypothetical protein n=1 Tax=Azospirillum doebereinerae TaxID=92933 RepID=UPI001EE5F7D3|nr:hypothetical protein [Azospirillum doebereinerae]MCG5238383.1 hypothetical protein [Azospirillum doebereinerae]